MLRRLSFVLACLILAGCPRADNDTKPAARQLPLEGVKLRLAVVDDPALAAAVVRLRGEWLAQTGSELEVAENSEKELLAAESPPADAVICPVRLLGPLAEKQLIQPMPQTIRQGEQLGGVFEITRLGETAWGAECVAVPLGSPVLCCQYRPDLLDKIGRSPPQTWDEYQQIAKLLAELPEANADFRATIEPLAPGWAGITLLARAAAYIKHRDNYSALFDIETMEPLAAGPPMVRALEELAAAAKLGPGKPPRLDPAEVGAAFRRGQCGMALTWPSAAKRGEGRGERGEEELVASSKDETAKKGEGGREMGDRGLVASATSEVSDEEDSIKQNFSVSFIELPGAKQVYNLNTKKWDARGDDEDGHVPLLGIAGRLGVVAVKSSHADAAWKLLLWLSDERISLEVSPASPATTLFRRSHLESPKRWVEASVSAAAASRYAEATAAALGRRQWLAALPIPGREEYLAALDEAVWSVIEEKTSAAEALAKTADKWREITNRRGLDAQRAAYRRSLGLD